MRRYRGIRCVWLVVMSVALLTIAGCAFLNPVTSSAVADLKDQLARDYPGWVVEQVHTQGNQGLLGKGATVSVVLRWPGPQDFHLNTGFFYGGGSGRKDWTHSDPSLFQDRQAALTFITAFRQRHPEPGLMVSLVGQSGDTTAAIKRAGPEGEFFDVYVWTQRGYAPSNGGLGSGGPSKPEQWRAVETSSGILWSY